MWRVLGVVGIALLVVLIGLVAFRLSERERRGSHDPGESDDGLDAAAVFAVLPQSAVLLDGNDVVERASAAAHIVGLVRNDRLAHPEVERMVADLRRTGRIRDAELTLTRGSVHGTGTLRLAVRVAPLPGERVLVLAEDRTAARRVEEMRRDFVANVSHELKTPVGALSLLAETVGEAADDPEVVRRFTGRMRKEAARLAELVQEIIDLSRLQEDDALVDPELVDVDRVVAEALDRVAVEATSRNVTLVGGGTQGLRVYGDRSLLTTAVRNLLDNAVRYSSPRSRVAVGVSRHDALVRIAVVDEGTGIPEDQRERVFERFYRLDEARSRDTGGSGLGLSIVKHIVQDHGGRVEIWSQPGRGSTFTVVLPEAYASPEAPGREAGTPADGTADAGTRRADGTHDGGTHRPGRMEELTS